MPRYLYAVAATLLIVSVSQQANAQDKQTRAATEPGQVDSDFAFQGEYVGRVATGDPASSSQQAFGLQVIAKGNGHFEAVAFLNGSSASDWYRGERVKLSGRRDRNTLVLQGEDLRIVVADGYASIHSSSGRLFGEISMVQRVSPTLGVTAPVYGQALFDGTSTEHFRGGKTTSDHLLQAGTELKEAYRDYLLHLEFRLPYMPHARGQDRANSGVYLQSRYEVQILDSFGLEGDDDQCGALYKYRRPEINMCYPPLSWQTYDIRFTAPTYDAAGHKAANARITVWHNGVMIHKDVDVQRKTGAGSRESPKLLPIKLQDHGNPVSFRNIWIIDYESRKSHKKRPPTFSVRESRSL